MPSSISLRKLRQARHIGGIEQVGFMARDQMAVLGGHQIGLHIVGTEFDAQRIGLQRVFGQVAAAAAAVADDQRLGLVALMAPIVSLQQRAAEQQTGERRADGQAAPNGFEFHRKSPDGSADRAARV
jgi:hypothetical protein